jgi:arabinogalactan oligomer/maltooligosaccharide transport system permease protein
LRFLALVLCLLCFSTSARAAETLDLWHAYRGEEKTALEQVVRAFEQRHPDVRVELLQVPHDAYASKLTAAAPRGHGPHVFIDSHERIGDLVGLGVVARVPPNELVTHEFQPVATAALGDLGLPLALKSVALYVNRDLLPEVPETLEELVQAPLPKGVFPLAYEVDKMYFHAPFLHAFGGRQLGENDAFGFDSEAGARSLDLVAKLAKDGRVPDEASGAVVTELFKSGRAATVMSGPWLASDLGTSVRYRVVPLPKLALTGEPLRPYLTVEGAVLTPRGGKEPRAHQLMTFLAGAESAEIREKVGRQVVARANVVATDENLAAFARQAETAVVMPSTPAMRATWEPADRALKKALEGAVNSRAALREARRRYDDVMRPLPPARSPTPLILFAGVISLIGAFSLVRRARDPEFRAAVSRSRSAYLWLAHAVIAVGVLVILPLVVGALTSLYAGRTPDELRYVGLANFVEILTARGMPLFSSGSFYLVLLVTLLWTLVNVAFHVGIGFSLGLLLSRPGLALKPLYRVLLIIPWAVPSYVTALAWKGMFSRQFGAVSALVELVGGEPFSWWARFSTAFSANVATNVWLGFPFMMVVTLGALTAVPKEVLEAAEVDGATRWQRLTRVTLPMVLPSMLPAVLLGAIWTFNMFNVVFLVSGGEPDGTTDILISEAYRWAFTRQAQYGYAAAYAVLIFVLLFASSRLMQRLSQKAAA